MNVVDKLVIALGLDTKGVDKGITEAHSKLATGFKGIMGKVFAPLMAGMSFAGIFDSIYSELKQMNKLSKTTKANIEDVTAWSRAVNISGGSVEEFSQTLMLLNQNLTRIAVTGHGRIKPFFEKLGVDATELAKKPVLESLEAIGKAIDGMDKRESANMLRSMGFDAGTIKLLQSGEKGIRELIARQRELGVYTEKDAKAFSAMNKSFKEITSSIKTLFIPAVMLILNVSSRVVQYLTTGIQYIRRNVDILRGAVVLLAAVFHKQLLKAVIDLGKVLMANPFGMFIIGLSAVLLLLEDLWVYAKGGKTAFGNIWKNLGTPEEVMQGFKRVGNAIAGLMKFVGSLFSGEGLGKTAKFLLILGGGIAALIAAIGWIPVAVAAAVGLLLAYWDEIEAGFSSVVDWFAGLGKRIRDYWGINGEVHKSLSEVWNRIGDSVESAISTIGNAISTFGNAVLSVWNWIKETAVGIWDAVGEAFDSAINYIISLWDGLKSAFSSGCAAIAGFLSDAANTARSAWASFIAWLEEKWNWIKSLLPSLTDIASKLPGIGTAMNVSAGGRSGGSSTVNNNQVYNVNNHTPEASRAFARSSGLVPQANGGIT